MPGLRRRLYADIKNVGRPVTRRKLVIFESDDWGSNRIASRNALERLVGDGILTEPLSHYNRNDTLARAPDLEILFETLSTVKDKNGRHAVFTPFVNVGNPDFEKIEKAGFLSYYWEDFFETLSRTGERDAALRLWRQGIQSGVFDPAFHGREHLCVPLWMDHLKEKNSPVRKAFHHRFYAVPIKGMAPEMAAFRPAFFFFHKGQIPFLITSITEGIQKMQDLFQTKPKVFCPPNGISHAVFDEASASAGIESIMTGRFRSEPDGKGGLKKRFHGYASRNLWNQRFYYRNCVFEPTYSTNPIDYCMMQIEAAFRWAKPAIICSHRVNYIGTINPENRDKGGSALKKLLKTVVRRWPDVEFISSNELSDLLHQKRVS